jgi:TolB protein
MSERWRQRSAGERHHTGTLSEQVVLNSSWVRAGALGVLGILQTASLPIAPVTTRLSPEPRIAFASHRDGNWEIYVMDADGTHQTRLTTRPEQDRFPLWSPDRSKLAFGSQVGSFWELWVMNADGTNARAVASHIAAKGGRAWSPDGSRVALSATVDGDLEILSVRMDGTAPLNLTKAAGEDRDPTWSPDGRFIAFSSTRGGQAAVYIMRADGSDVRRLTTDTTANEAPSFAPDGSAIAFVTNRDSVGDVYIVRPDGTQLRRLTVNAHATRDLLRWSPDASHIAFQAAHGVNYDLDHVRVADMRHTQLAATVGYDGMCTWSPDSRRIAFISDRDSVNAIYVADIDGNGLRRLTMTATLNPAFAP